MQIGCVILAAGEGSRFGENKLLAPFRGKPLARWAFEALPPGVPALVVTRWPGVEALARDFGFALIRNEAPALGISHSVALGTRALGPSCEGLMFLVADQPLLRRATVERLLAAFAAAPERVIVPRAGAREGNPCVFPRALYPELLALEGDRGGKQLLRRRPELACCVEVPPEELADVDTAADLEAL